MADIAVNTEVIYVLASPFFFSILDVHHKADSMCWDLSGGASGSKPRVEIGIKLV